MIREAIAFHIEGLPGTLTHCPNRGCQSARQARAYHFASLSDAEEPVPELQTTFGMVEVDLISIKNGYRAMMVGRKRLMQLFPRLREITCLYWRY